MKICYLSDFRSIHTMRWIKYFAQHHEVHLISLDKPAGDGRMLAPEEYTKVGINVHLVQMNGSKRLLVPFHVRRLIRDIGPNIIHCHYISHYGFLGALSGFRPNVMTAWGTDVLLEPEESFVKKCQVRFALRRADVVTCDGENMAARLVSLGLSPNRIRRIYFGVDTNKANPDRRDKRIFEKYLKGQDSRVVIDIRGFASVYDPGTFIQAAAQVLRSHPHTIFVMAREGEERKEFEKMADSLGILDSFAFVGNIPADQMPVYLASSDVYVSTSLSDSGIAASTAEAMACGVAVVSTDVGDIHIWIEDGVNGFITPRKDVAILVERINTLLGNDGLRQSLGAEARKSMQERQDYQKEMGKMESLYQQLIKGGGK